MFDVDRSGRFEDPVEDDGAPGEVGAGPGGDGVEVVEEPAGAGVAGLSAPAAGVPASFAVSVAGLVDSDSFLAEFL